ncbi:MAG: hypothetical protein B6U69_00530, partial [Thermofilum sp. ex4484_15]
MYSLRYFRLLFVTTLAIALLISSTLYSSSLSSIGIKIIDYRAPRVAEVNRVIKIAISLAYSFPYPTRVYIGVWDPDSHEWLDYRDEYLVGNGFREYNLKIQVPSYECLWQPTVYAFHLNGYTWVLSDKVTLTIKVVSFIPKHIEEYAYLSKSSPEAITTFDLYRSTDSDGNGKRDAFVYITVPPNTGKLDILMTVEPNDDVDLRLYDPYGRLAGVSQSGMGEAERIEVINPVEGVWKLVVEEFHITGPTAWVRVTVRGIFEVIKVSILGVTFYPARVTPGSLIKVSVTIRNEGTVTLAGGLGPKPGFTYSYYDDYLGVGYPSVKGYLRLGVDFDKRPHSVDHPYRWGLSRDLRPGEEATIIGYIQAPPSPGRYMYWVGIVIEGVKWIADKVGITTIYVTLPVRYERTGFSGTKISMDGMSADVYAPAKGGWYSIRLDRKTMKYELRDVNKGNLRTVTFFGNRIYVEGYPIAWSPSSKVIIYTKSKFTVDRIVARVMTHNAGGYNRYGTRISLGILLSDGSLISLASVKVMPDRWYTLRAKVPGKYSNYHIAIWMTQASPNRYYISPYEFRISELKYYKPSAVPIIDYDRIVAVKNYGDKAVKVRASYVAGSGLSSLTLLFNGY